MREKNLKLIMELIFIFILPLVLLSFSTNITVENNFTYDSNGNYDKELSTKKLIFDNSFIKFENGYKNIIENFNLWDEEIINGYRIDSDTGDLINVNNFFISSNFINVTPNQTYYFYNGGSGDYLNYFRIALYDINKNYIGANDGWISTTNSIKTMPNNCYYIRFQTYGTTYNHDICINKSIQWANGNYVPYGKPLILYTDTDVSGQNNINYSIWGKIKNLLIDNLCINDSIILNIIICYTMLWFIMFIIWHFFYLFFDGLVHLFVDWKKRGE